MHKFFMEYIILKRASDDRYRHLKIFSILILISMLCLSFSYLVNYAQKNNIQVETKSTDCGKYEFYHFSINSYYTIMGYYKVAFNE